jgi:itaconate CoA-transferase
MKINMETRMYTKHAESKTDSQLPLQGLLVVSAEQAVAAPVATCRLADAGARVIKIERKEGDSARGFDRAARGMSSYFAWTNRGKESLVLDYKAPDDAALLERLLARADIFVQNIAPGALARAGFGSDALRKRYPRLITCDITGYGNDNPASGLKAYDLLVQCESGLVSVSGAPDSPGRFGVSICDIGAGMNATIGILTALARRERTGLGSAISVSLFDGAADWMTVPYIHERYGDGAPGPMGLRHPSIAPYGAFQTRDAKQIVISVQNDREWVQFSRTFLLRRELEDDQRFATNVSRVANRSALDALIAVRFAELLVDDAKKLLDEANIAYGQVKSVAELARHPALRTWPMPNTDSSLLDMIAPPVRADWDLGRFQPAPLVGEHSDSIRREFASSKYFQF